MDIEEKKYRNKITLVSFFLALIVVIQHTYNVEVYGLQSGYIWFFESFLRSFSEVAVPFFFVMSGYLFFVNFSYEKLFVKWKSRIFSIAIPYLIWNIVAYLFYQAITLIPFVSNNINQSVEELSIKMLLLNAIFGYHNITWFLRNLMIYIIITPLLYFILKYKLSMIIVLPGVFLLNEVEHIYTYHWFFYILGAYIGIHFSKAIKEKSFSKYSMVLSSIGLIICSIINMDCIGQRPNRFLILFSIVLLWIMLDFLRTEREPAWWMRISFFIYCTHSMILESIEKVFLIVVGNNNLGAIIDFIFAPMITILIIIVGAYVFQKIPKLWKVLNGNRT